MYAGSAPVPWDRRLVFAGFLTLMIAATPEPLLGQGLNDETTVDTIIDADVETKERQLAQERQRILDAIGRSSENATEIRKRTNIDQVEIVLVPRLSDDTSPLAESIEANREAIEEVREAIEASAIFFNAVDSRGVLLKDVVAVEFGQGDKLTVFAAGQPGQN